MRTIHRLIISSCLFFSSSAFAAYEVFLDPLYWRATEVFDWEHSNNLNSQNLAVSFKAVSYDFDPGIRVGVGYEGVFDTKIYFTKFDTTGKDTAQGNLTTGFIPGRLSQTAPTTFYNTAQASYHINFNMIDWNIGKHFDVTESLMLRPYVGLEGAVIDQTFNTSFQSQKLQMNEHVTNNFSGLGPKLGIETNLIFWRVNDYHYSLVADLTTSYLWGRWSFYDMAKTTTGGKYYANAANRSFASLGLQAMLGAGVTNKNFSAKLGYEISDWANQCQFLDDETGTKSVDLVLQGLTLSLSYKF